MNGICINRRLLCNSIKSRKGVYGSYNTRSNGKKQLFHHGEKASAKVAENESSCKNMTRPTEDTLQNSNDYLRQIDCLGFAGSVVKRNAGCQDPAHCLSGFLSKAGSFLPGFIFSCAPARNRFALRRRSLLPKAFAPAATWTRLCSRSSRTGGWLHSRYRETSASPYQKEGTIARPRSEHLIFLSVGRSGRQLRDSRSYAMVLGDLRRCKTAFYRTGHRATIYGAGAVMRHRATILYRMSAAISIR